MASVIENDLQKHRDTAKITKIPQTGLSEEALVSKLEKWSIISCLSFLIIRRQKVDRKIYGEKKITGTIYSNENEKLTNIVKDVASKIFFRKKNLTQFLEEYFYVNPLHFDLFPTANQMEGEVIYMVKNLYNGTCRLVCYFLFIIEF